MTGQKEYRRFWAEQEGLHLMMSPTWLDALCGDDGWDAVVISDELGFCAAMPFECRKKLKMTKWRTPPWTHHSGPWVRPSGKASKQGKLSDYHKSIEQLINFLPSSDFFEVKLDPKWTDVQPWQWRGYEASPAYTYILDTSKGIKGVKEKCNRTIRKYLNGGIPGFIIDGDPEDAVFFFKEHHPYWNEALQQSLSLLLEHEEMVIQTAFYNVEGHDAACLVFIEINGILYLLASAVDRTSADTMAFYGLLALLIDQVQFEISTIDFMGSADPHLAQNFRGLGGIPQAYFVVKKAKNTLLKWVH